jgi:dihydroxyacetone kinase
VEVTNAEHWDGKVMKKLINEPESFVDEMLEGLLAAHPAELRRASTEERALLRADAPVAGKVAIVTGGGSGHLPVFLGFVGFGLATGVAVGNVFSSPSSDAILAATQACHGGAGVLYLYGNYTGDRLNFELAAELAEAEGIASATVLVNDDVASAPPDRSSERRGVAGMVFAFKCAGAAAERGDDLATVAEIARRTVAATRTMGVGLSAAVVPTVGKPTFVLADDEMEIGVGIHGEPGVRRGRLQSADAVADELFDGVAAELALGVGCQVAVLVNGLGATPVEELYILFRRIQHRLDEEGAVVHRAFVGEYATSLEMAGASVTILGLDEELMALLDAPARSPFWRP